MVECCFHVVILYSVLNIVEVTIPLSLVSCIEIFKNEPNQTQNIYTFSIIVRGKKGNKRSFRTHQLIHVLVLVYELYSFQLFLSIPHYCIFHRLYFKLYIKYNANTLQPASVVYLSIRTVK